MTDDKFNRAEQIKRNILALEVLINVRYDYHGFYQKLTVAELDEGIKTAVKIKIESLKAEFDSL